MKLLWIFFGGEGNVSLGFTTWVLGKTPRIGLASILRLSNPMFNLLRDPQIAFQRCSPFHIRARNVVSFSASSPVLGGRKTDWQKGIYTKEVF